MKKFLALAALVLGLASCQNEPEGLGVVTGGEVDTVVTVSLPAATRATNSAEGAFANVDLSGDATIRYILKIYQKVGDEYVASNDRQVEYSDEKSVVFPVRLVPNRDYRFVVWADYAKGEADVDYHYNTTDLTKIELNGEWNAMDETRDAFTGYFDTAVEGQKYTGASSINIALTRPFAKLRVITTDMEQLKDLGIEPKTATVEYTVDHYNAFNAFAGEAIGDSKNRNIKHENFTIKAYGDNVDDKSMVLFTDYFFANNDVVKFKLTVVDQNGAVIDDTITFPTDINVKRNHLTTIIGDILTDGNNINVEVNDEFEAKNTILDVFERGGEYTLTEDIISPANNLIVKKDVVLNLGGRTIKAGKEYGNGMTGTDIAAITVVNGATLTIEGVGAIEGTEYGVYVKEGNVVIKGGNFVAGTSAVQVNKGTATIEGGTFSNTDSDKRYTINCIDTNWKNGDAQVKIKGGEFKNFNPANNAAEGVGTCFVAEGYVSLPAEDNCFEVVELAGEITLPANLTPAKSLVVLEGKSLKLNLGDFNIINAGATDDLGVADAIIVYGKLEINGEGTVQGKTRSVWARGETNAEITINGGKYVGAVVDGGTEVIYASGNGKITINGGTFEASNIEEDSFAAPQYAVLNLHNNGAAGCDIKVYGGSFKNFNPADNISENPKHNFCAEGYTAVANGEWYNVVSWDSIAIDNVVDLKAALAAGQSTINLKGGVVFEGVFNINQNTTIICHNTEDKAVIKGRVNIVNCNPTFIGVKFDTNDDSKAAFTLTGWSGYQYEAIVGIHTTGGATFNNCSFNYQDTSAITNANGFIKVTNCDFVGNSQFAIYSRANIEITDSTVKVTVPDGYESIAGFIHLNALENGKAIVKNITGCCHNGADMGHSICFGSTNNDANGVWVGPVTFDVQGNTGFTYTFYKFNSVKISHEDHIFADGSKKFTWTY